MSLEQQIAKALKSAREREAQEHELVAEMARTLEAIDQRAQEELERIFAQHRDRRQRLFGELVRFARELGPPEARQDPFELRDDRGDDMPDWQRMPRYLEGNA